MTRNLKHILIILFILVGQQSFAQELTVKGNVTDQNGLPLPGTDIQIKGTVEGTQSDLDGNFSLKANKGDIVIISFLGMKTQELKIDSTTLNIVLIEESTELENIVVTALGITRNKKSLGYSSQELEGSTLAATPVTNFAEALSGQIAGLNIKASGTIGGSSNMVIRGFSSLFGDNQALIVVDGTPINNKTFNTRDQMTGVDGYDYGNAATDINPDDIESLNVLKGAAATALYGSRGQNGVIMITTKKGKESLNKISAEFNSSLTIGTVDIQTLPKYQKKYGGGYRPLTATENGHPDNPYFVGQDIDGDGILDYVVQFNEDASFGAEFDPNLMVFQWNSAYPELSTYKKPTPWIAAKTDPNYIWKPSFNYVNSASIYGSNQEGGFRLGITNNTTDGNLLNSHLSRNTLNFSGNYNITKKLKAEASITYTNNKGKGRVGTGYEGSTNPMQFLRQWWQVNVDMKEQEQAYYDTNESNATWNIASFTNLKPRYSDNYFFIRNKNLQSDSRNRYTGNTNFNYEITPWLNLIGRYSFDNYDEIREGRLAIGTVGSLGEYSLLKQTISENNYDAILNIDTNITDNITIDANLGWNLRVEKTDRLIAATNGGLQIPGVYSLTNSINPLTPEDLNPFKGTKSVDGLYARTSFGFYNLLYIDASLRTDRSSALWSGSKNRYWYPSISGSFIFSELINTNIIKFGKIRANYARVGNDTDIYNLYNSYEIKAPFGSSGTASNPDVFLNKFLKPEMMSEYELGLEMAFLQNRVSLEVSYYNRKTKDLITPADISSSSGAMSVWMNAGVIENKGIEASLNFIPIKTEDFIWNLGLNYAKNNNKVLELNGDNDYLQLAALRKGISIGAKKGEPYGVIRGTGYVYNEDGKKLVGSNGQYIHGGSDTVIGDMNPKWTGGIKNHLTYKNLKLSFLIDFQKGGDIFSLDTFYGFASGLYDNYTSGLNDLGNPVRNTLENGGGVILDGVLEDGTPNNIRVRADQGNGQGNPWGYLGGTAPAQAHIYDASYVKLRNVTLSYDLPKEFIKNLSIEKFTISAIGRNLWIIHKNIPYSDPEAGLSAGNIQGYQSGAYPSIREIGASIKVQF